MSAIIKQTDSAITWRALGLGLLVALITAWANPWLEMAWGSTGAAGSILPQMGMALFVVIIMINLGLKKRKLRATELIVIFAIIFTGSSVCNRIPSVIGYIALPESGIQSDVFNDYAKPLLSEHFYIQDDEVAHGYLTGRIPAFAVELERRRQAIREIEESQAQRALTLAEQRLLERSRARAAELTLLIENISALEEQTAAKEQLLLNLTASSKLLAADQSIRSGESDEAQAQLEALRQDIKSLQQQSRLTIRSYWYGRILKAWIPPLLSWGWLIAGLALFGAGYTCLIRKQWIEDERIVTPLLEAPLMLVEGIDGKSVFRNKVFMVGFLFALSYMIWNILASLWPALPALTLQHAAWASVFGSQYGMPPNPVIILRIYLPVLAVSFFIRRDVLFSIVFFWVITALLARFLDMSSIFFSNAYFLEGNAYNCNTNWIAMGAFLGFGIMTIFMSRRFLWRVARHILGLKTELNDASEMLPYRLSALLTFGGLALFYWSLLRFGVLPWLALVFTVSAAVILIAATRLVLETGLIFFRTPISLIDAMLYSLRNTLANTWTSIPGVAAGYVYFGDTKNFTAQAFMHANKLAGHLPPRRSRSVLGAGVAVAVILSILVGLSSQLIMSYSLGVNTMRNTWLNRELPRGALEQGARALKDGNVPLIQASKGETAATLAQSPEFKQRIKDNLNESNGMDRRRGLFLLGGFVGMLALTALRIFVVWWPIHPIGLLLCHSDATAHAFFSIFLAWLVKFLALRIGGTAGLRKVGPCFAGLLAGCALGVLISWLVGLGDGLYVCHNLQNWSWDTFMQSRWVSLLNW